MKKIYLLQGGMQRVQQALDYGIQAIEIIEDEAPDNVSDGAFMYTQFWHTRPEAIAEEMNDCFPEASFGIGEMNGQMILEISMG